MCKNNQRYKIKFLYNLHKIMQIREKINQSEHGFRQTRQTNQIAVKNTQQLNILGILKFLSEKHTQDINQILNQVDRFKQSIFSMVYSSVYHYFTRIHQKHSSELMQKEKVVKISKQKNQRINNQIMQLKSMFDQTLSSYRNQILIKEDQIKALKQCIQQLKDCKQLRQLQMQTRKSVIDNINQAKEINIEQMHQTMKEGRLISRNSQSKGEQIKEQAKMRVSTFLKSQIGVIDYFYDNTDHHLSVIQEVEQNISTNRSPIGKQFCEMKSLRYQKQALTQKAQQRINRSPISDYFSSRQSHNQQFSAQLIATFQSRAEERIQISPSALLEMSNRNIQSQCLSLLQKRKLLQKSFQSKVLKKDISNCQKEQTKKQICRQSGHLEQQMHQIQQYPYINKQISQQFISSDEANKKSKVSSVVINDSSICTEMQQNLTEQIEQSSSTQEICKAYSIQNQSIFSHSLNSQNHNQSKTESLQVKSKDCNQSSLKIIQKLVLQDKQQKKRYIKTQYIDPQQTRQINSQHKRFYSFGAANSTAQQNSSRTNHFLTKIRDTKDTTDNIQKRGHSSDQVKRANIDQTKNKNSQIGFISYHSQGKIKYDKENIKPRCNTQKSISRQNSKQKSLSITKMIKDLKYGNDQSYQNYNKHKRSNLSNVGSFDNSVSLFNKHIIGISNDKDYLKQLKSNVKQTLRRLKLWQAQDEFTYQGSIKNGVKQGYGILTYTDGLVYQGYFSKNKKHGKGKVIMNGLTIFDGEFFNDKIEGQGYIKSLKLFSTKIQNGLVNSKMMNKLSAKQSKFLMMKKPQKIFSQSGNTFQLRETAYSGVFENNMFHGNGVIYLNSRQKIATNFERGIPYGDLTYYNDEAIQFSSWQS